MDLTSIEKAVAIANDNGWSDGEGDWNLNDELVYKIVLDRLFWQALGKGLGWDKKMTYYNTFTEGKENNDPWRLEMHRFIDHLAEGKSIDSFFESLLQ